MIIKFFLSLILLVCYPPFLLFAWDVPDTGQTLCYMENPGNPGQWVVGDCPLPGDALYGQDAHYTSNPPSFTKLDLDGNELSQDAVSWVMVRDDVTGLIWEVKVNSDDVTDYANPTDADNVYTWYNTDPSVNGGVPGTSGVATDTMDFINAMNSLMLGGFSDWRLPTAKEIALLFIRYRDVNDWPFLDPDYFPNVKLDQNHNSLYWSDTTDLNNSVDAWTFDFSDWNGMFVQDKSRSYYVRAVRGQSIDGNDFADNGDGTVTDVSTGLMWQQDSLPYNWESALAYCENLDLAGHSDWRLPNINELLTLLDHTRSGLSIDMNYFSNTATLPYWSSTSQHLNDRAWGVWFDFGNVFAEKKQNNAYVRAVRNVPPSDDGEGSDKESDSGVSCFVETAFN